MLDGKMKRKGEGKRKREGGREGKARQGNARQKDIKDKGECIKRDVGLRLARM